MLSSHHIISFAVICYIHGALSLPYDDPTQWPGHLQPFGSQQTTAPVDEVYDWPTPTDFFRNYVDKTRPVVVRGAYKYSKARGWNNEALRGSKDRDQEVWVETSLKENRTNIGGSLKLSRFLDFYQKRPLLMFSTIPTHLMKDVEIPSPLRCNETQDYLVNANAVISQGGSKSTVHNDDVETIYCSFQGTVDTILIEYTKNRNYVIDRPQGGYSTLDVERVDFTKYPNLRKIDAYLKVTLQEGDCVYIPYRWYKQQNSFANREGRSISLNMWFNHIHDHNPSECPLNNHDATLDKFQFSDMKMLAKDGLPPMLRTIEDNGKDFEGVEHEEDGYERPDLLDHFNQYFRFLKRKEIHFKHFYMIIKKDESITQQNHDGLEFPKTFKILALELFTKLDKNSDTILTPDEFIIKDKKKEKDMSQFLEYQIARLEDYVEDLVEAKHHDEPMHAFEARMYERFRSQKKYDEL